MKIVFVGTTEFGLPTLEKLKSQFELCFVITTPDKPVGRKKIITPSPIKSWAVAKSVEFLETEKILLLKDKIFSASPDIIIVASFGQMIPQDILDIPKLGCLNIHPSLLPKYRGPTPIQSALENCDKETGVSIIFMDKQMDHGDIVAQKRLKIDDADDYMSLQNKLAGTSADIMIAVLTDIEQGKITKIVQNDNEATFTKIINFKESRIDWTVDAKAIYKKIQAYKHEPGVWTKHKDKVIKILKSSLTQSEDHLVDLPGKLSTQDSKLKVHCGTGSLLVEQLQVEGKNPISGLDFYNGIQKISDKLFI
jgi:methionyl-tRNA formyltransferase